jgi:hypothetical protein
MIVGGIGLFIGANYAKEPSTRLVMQAGGILGVIAGAVLGGEALFEKLGFGKILAGQDKAPEKTSTDPIKGAESDQAMGHVSGQILSPADGANLDPGFLSTGYDVSVRVFNDSAHDSRVRVDLSGVESYAFSSDSEVGASLGEWAVKAGQSINLTGHVGLGTYAHLPLASPHVRMDLQLDGVVVDTVNFTWD